MVNHHPVVLTQHTTLIENQRVSCYVSCTVLAVPPRFTKELAEKTLTLPVGSSTAVELPFAASPTPKVTWTFNGGKLPDPKRFKTDTISAMTSLTMAKLVRKDAGKYAVALENEHGKCELTVTLVVLGKTTPSCFVGWLGGSVVERRSLIGELSLLCASRPLLGQPTRPTQPFILTGSINE